MKPPAFCCDCGKQLPQKGRGLRCLSCAKEHKRKRVKEGNRKRRSDPAYKEWERQKEQERMQDPAYRKRRSKVAGRRQKEYFKDPVWRKILLARAKKRRLSLGYHKHRAEYQRKKMQDPVYKARQRKNIRKWVAKHRKDPAYLQKIRESDRIRKRRYLREKVSIQILMLAKTKNPDEECAGGSRVAPVAAGSLDVATIVPRL